MVMMRCSVATQVAERFVNVCPLKGCFAIPKQRATSHPVVLNDIPANATQFATFSSGHN